MSKALLVLAGGFGTRLRSAVADLPKPLAPVDGRPFLQYQMENWLEQGVREFVFLLHHQAGLIQDFLAGLSRTVGLPERGVNVVTLVEERPLGTGGAVAFAVARRQLRDSFLVTNADTWLGGGAAEMAAAGPDSIGVVRVEDSGRYGAVNLSPGGNVLSFQEKRPDAGAGWINAGLYHLHPEQFMGWDGQPFSIEQRLFPRLVGQGTLRAVPLHTPFIDIGVPAEYFRFCRWIESRKAVPL